MASISLKWNNIVAFLRTDPKPLYTVDHSGVSFPFITMLLLVPPTMMSTTMMTMKPMSGSPREAARLTPGRTAQASSIKGYLSADQLASHPAKSSDKLA
jgi:hypothetical protein